MAATALAHSLPYHRVTTLARHTLIHSRDPSIVEEFPKAAVPASLLFHWRAAGVRESLGERYLLCAHSDPCDSIDVLEMTVRRNEVGARF